MDAGVEDMLSPGAYGEPNLGRKVVHLAFTFGEE